jgi:hypothetical protein
MGSSFTVVDSNVQESSVTRGQMFMDQVSLGNFCYRDKKKDRDRMFRDQA